MLGMGKSDVNAILSIMYGCPASPLRAQDSNILAACIQAAATLHAGKLQATAARLAGWLTFSAGSMTIGAALIAYLAAGRPVRLQEQQHRYRSQALRLRFGTAIVFYNALLEFTRKEYSRQFECTRSDPAIRTIKCYTLSQIGLFDPQAWEQHAILGRLFSERALAVDLSIRIYNLKLVSAATISKGLPLSPSIDYPHEVTLPLDQAREANVEVDKIEISLAGLLQEINNQDAQEMEGRFARTGRILRSYIKKLFG